MTHTLIALNLGVFVVMAVLASMDQGLAQRVTSWGAVGRDLVPQGVVLHEFGVWQPITSAFLHGGFMHIFGNMIFLMVFGPSVEDRYGRLGFLLFYLGGAVVSALAHMAIEPVPAIGASGAVAAVSGAFLVLFPRTRIKCFVLFLIIGVFMIPSWWIIGLYIVLDLFSHVITPDNGIANVAHLGGYAMGIGVASLLLGTKVLEREPYDLVSIFKQRQRRKAFASANKIHQGQMDRVRADKAPSDPRAEHLAKSRAQVGSLLSQGDADGAADAYLQMIDEFGHDTNAPTTLHRDAQYQVANTLYQRGQRIEAAEAFGRLLSSYPSDSERHVIQVVIARTRAGDQGDIPGAVSMLEELLEDGLDADTKTLVNDELQRIRDQIQEDNQPKDDNA